MNSLFFKTYGLGIKASDRQDYTKDLYITDVTRNGIVKYDPRTQSMSLVASSEGVHWPDTPAIRPEGDLIFTSSSLNDHFAGAVKPGHERYDVSRSILIATTDPRTSNSGALYLALTSHALNGYEVVTDRETARRLAGQIAELFKRQGYQENYVNTVFDDYLSIGMGKVPLVFLYEYQIVAHAMANRPIPPDAVLLYPKPTLFSKEGLSASPNFAPKDTIMPAVAPQIYSSLPAIS